MTHPFFLKLVYGYFGAFSVIFLLLGFNRFHRDTFLVQPIAYSHRQHIQNVGLTCDYCHRYFDKGKKAVVPAVGICMDCHSGVATEKPEIKKLTAFYEKKQPVPWNRVHTLPEHVYFSHKRHIKAKVACVSCHGEIGKQERVRRFSSLSMGFCVSCHREKNASLDCLTCHK